MFIYLTTNLINSKIYIGQTIHNKESYIGSGVLLHKAIKKYGKENFKKDILLEVNTQRELDEAEIFLIKEYNSTDRNIGYNLNEGGQAESRTGTSLHKETKRKISESLRGYKHTDETKAKMSDRSSGSNNAMYGRSAYDIWVSKYGKAIADKKLTETKLKISKAGLDRKMTDEHKEKIRQARILY